MEKSYVQSFPNLVEGDIVKLFYEKMQRMDVKRATNVSLGSDQTHLEVLVSMAWLDHGYTYSPVKDENGFIIFNEYELPVMSNCSDPEQVRVEIIRRWGIQFKFTTSVGVNGGYWSGKRWGEVSDGFFEVFRDLLINGTKTLEEK